MMLGDVWWPPAAVLWVYTVANTLQGVLALLIAIELPRGSGWFRALRVLLGLTAIVSLGTAVATCKLLLMPSISVDEILVRVMGPTTLARWCTVLLLAWGAAYAGRQRRAG